MKSQPATHVSGKSDLHKVSKTKGRTDSVTQEEMQALLAKLKDLVPNMPKNRKLSKLEIIQYVIDYIVDLQNALETHPAARTNNPFAATSPTTVSPNRQPLGVLSPTGNSVANTCTPVELSHLEKIPAHLAELVSGIAPRQVSC